MSRIYPKGLPEVAWILHESGYSLLALVLWPWSYLSLLFITVLSYRGLRPSRGVTPSMVFPTQGYREVTLSMPGLATPSLGDSLAWRRPLLATPSLGDAWCSQSVDSLLWALWVVPPYVDFGLDVDFGQRPGTGRYNSWFCYSYSKGWIVRCCIVLSLVWVCLWLFILQFMNSACVVSITSIKKWLSLLSFFSWIYEFMLCTLYNYF